MNGVLNSYDFSIMSILSELSDPASWDAYFQYKKENRHLTKSEETDLLQLITGREYLPVTERILCGGSFSVPKKKMIRKMNTGKKRVVYTYPREENYVLKLLTWLLLRKYDGIFSENLYSFRVSYGTAKAMGRILSSGRIREKFTYKADIHNYFNSIDPDLMLRDLSAVLTDDEPLYEMFRSMLLDRRALDRGRIIEEEKGVMAGTPFAVFLANIYLREMDREFSEKGLLYARYSDDIIVFTDTAEEREEAEERIREILTERKLSLNPEKEIRTDPGQMWTFLGISYENGTVDISPVSREKLKAKIRRKARNIRRWQVRKGARNDQAARAFLRAMNRKFFDCDVSSELTWTRWYFPLISTDRSLREIDRYMQYWARVLASGTRSGKRYGFRYTDLKEAGYVSLLHEWYRYRKDGFSV